MGPQHASSTSPTSYEQAAARARLVEQLTSERGVRNQRVLGAIGSVPRERFIPAALGDLAYVDRALPIALDQTISQPYIVALMTDLSCAGPGQRVLEIGTGCGYQTAVLAATGAEVYSIEILEPLAREAAARLAALGVEAELRIGNGFAGMPDAAPFDAIVVTAAPPELPRALVDQLAVGGRLVCPIGPSEGDQELVVLHKTPSGERVEPVAAVRFVPMTGGRQAH